IRVVYHFTSSRSPSSLVALEVEVPRGEPRLPSISDVYPAAELQEREQREMLGVEFEGLRDRRHLLLPEDWPEGVYPLRKDFRVPDEPFMSTRPSGHSLEDLQRMLAELEGEGGNQ
ncbi:MAG: NADH-quinone oxidoreductase subunit C, partial [Crenarchaeota archaeon]|nr:NADH-quinone oxidoreductase subunit C [Thermoproteota archaeon]